MDVSRIEAVTPRTIDWRRLTAREIIKYDQEGIEVPEQYLSWAKEFQQSLTENDKDTTTYEMATSASIQTETEPPTDSAPDPNEEPTSEGGTEKTPAQQKREELINAGYSLRSQARIFTNDSNDANNAVLQSAAIITDTEDKSNSEIQALESQMSELISKAEATQNKLKNEIQKINNDKSDKSTFAKIEKLNQQLQQLGESGQASLAGAETDFNNYDLTINSQTETIFNAGDFGAETIGVGNELLDSIRGFYIFRIIDYIVGKRAVHTGETTVTDAQITDALKTEAQGINSENRSEIYGYQNQIQQKTGVAAIKTSKEENNNELENEKSEALKNESTKTTAAVTETDKASSANLEQILMSKIRRGEDINT